MNFKVRAFLGLCTVAFSLNAGAINISTEGGGTVSPDLNGKYLIGGRTYTLTAKPRTGYTFDYWSLNGYEYRSPKVDLTLLNGYVCLKGVTNLDLIGSFDSYFTAFFNPKGIVPGTYIGIYTDTETMYSTFRISANGAFSARIFLQGQWHSLSGKFSEDGRAHATLRLENKRVGLSLYVDSYDGTLSAITDPEEPDSALNFLFATLVPATLDPTITTYFGGKYAVTIAGQDDASVPKGDGYASASIDRSGHVHALGRLADGTPFTQSAALSGSPFAEWPLFLALKGGTETLAGRAVSFIPGGPVGGSVTWEKSRQTRDLSYPEGFRCDLGVNCSFYLPPNVHGDEPLENTNLWISFDGGTLPIQFAAAATLTSDGQIVVNDPTNQIAIAIQSNTGVFSGSAIPPGQSDPIHFQGAVYGDLPEGYYGSGFFLQDNLSGRVQIVAPSPP